MRRPVESPIRFTKLRIPFGGGGGRENDTVENDEQQIELRGLNRVHSMCPGVFGTIVAGHAHRLKSNRTSTHNSVADAQVSYHILPTTTSKMNRPLISWICSPHQYIYWESRVSNRETSTAQLAIKVHCQDPRVSASGYFHKPGPQIRSPQRLLVIGYRGPGKCTLVKF